MGQNMTYFGSFWVDFDPFLVIFWTPLFEVVPWVFRCFGLFWVIFGSKKGPKIGPNMTQNGSILGHFGSFLAIFGDPQISPFWPKPHGSSLLLGLPGQKGSKSGQVLGPGFDPILGHF